MAQPRSGDEFSPSGGWGVMPGTGRCLDLLQLEPNWRSRRDRQEDRRYPVPPSANWYSYYCDATNDGCLQSPDKFAGTRNCRQCIEIDSIRVSTRGDWREYSHSYVSTVVNVGDWLANSTHALTALWTSFSVSNPATYCIDTGRLYYAWRKVWEQFFDAFIPAAWMVRDAYPSRALVSHFAAWSLVSREDGDLGGRGTLLDWRMRRWGANLEDGIHMGPVAPVPPVYSGCPVEGPCMSDPDVLAIRRIEATPFLLENSVWAQAIEPAVQRLAQVQLAGYQTTTCAYLWMDQGAHADPSTGELRKDQFGQAFEEGLRAIVNSARLRDAVHMAHVVDPRIKKLLLESGAHPWQTGTSIAAPPEPSSTDGKPPRARTTVDDEPILAFASDWLPPPPVPPLVGGFPRAPTEAQPPAPAPSSRAPKVAAVAAGLTLAGVLGWAVARRRP